MTKRNNYIELVIDSASAEAREIAMAQLIGLGFDGFTEEGDRLKAYIQEPEFQQREVEEICTSAGLSWKAATIANKNWNEEWESSFEPVRLDDFCMIRAEFHSAEPTVLYDIVITPKMSFGTGHHATTLLMMQGMRAEDFAGRSVLDFGTGTGILAILAEKMGAASVLAIDNDDWSIENGKENLLKNGCEKVSLLKSDIVPDRGQFDLVLANINRNVILEHMKSVALVLAEGGVVLFSGFLTDDLPFISQSMELNRIRMTTYTEQNGWLSVRGEM